MFKSKHVKSQSSPSKLQNDLKDALANLKLEGIKPSPEALHDMEQHAAGKISSEEMIARATARAKLRNNKK